MSALLHPFFDQALQVFEALPGGRQVHTPCVAGQPVRLRYASPALAAALQPALGEPEAGGETPSLTILAWGGEMPGGLLPAPPWQSLPSFERGNVRGYQSGRYTLVYDRRPEVFSAFDAERRLGVYWARDSRGLPYYERAAPMRRLFQAWLQTRGRLVLHAAALGTAAGGLLLAGRTGSGKSTTAAAGARAGLGYAGDDYVIVEPGTAPRLHGLYRSLKLNRQMLEWMPDLAAQVSNPERLAIEKALVYWPASGASAAGGLPLRAILLPHPTQNLVTTLRRVAPEAAFRAIVPDTLFSLLGEPKPVSGAVRQLVSQVPCFELALGSDLEQMVDVLRAALSASETIA